ncbi:MAG TPA: hypothetical protein PK854_02275 [Oscillospiraceae bacterium]|nr:hypothetical protein [Oscillospiraceae bacterium]HPS34071.1 hypothetical protein [Oscillospiraceae bacterium]
MDEFYISAKDKAYLRELAKKQAEYAALPVMAERTKQWYAHNAVKGVKPLIVVEQGSFGRDFLPEMKCEGKFAADLERQLLSKILQHERIDDDIVVPGVFEVYMDVECREFGVPVQIHHATDTKGRDVGYEFSYPIKSLEKDFNKLKPFEFNFDRKRFADKLAAVREAIGDILPCVPTNRHHVWYYMHTAKVIQLLSMEQWMYELADNPDAVHQLMRYLNDNMLRFIDWLEREKLFTPDNGNNYAGAGSYGFTDELKIPADGKPMAKNVWGNVNSQESFAISPDMYAEFVYPYIAEIAERFGLVYYGCCEPVHALWHKCLKNLPNMRKVSISAWCDEDIMGEALRGTKVIYSRKPSPKFLGVDPVFDEDGYRKYMKDTLSKARGCEIEIIFRDVYTLMGDPGRPAKAVKVLREVIEDCWRP